MFKNVLATGYVVAFSAVTLFADDAERKPAPLHAQASWEFGEIEQAYLNDETKNVDRELINHATVWTLQEFAVSENAKAFIGIGGAYFFVYPRNLGSNPYSHSKRSGLGISDAHGEFTFFPGEGEDYGLLLKAGVFPFKYNEDAKNLGEYMFRTWTYPTIITTGGLEFINSAGAQVTGFDISTSIKGLKNDLLLSVQTDHAPISSLSLTDIVGYNIGGVLSIKAGFMLDNFYNPDTSVLAPKLNENQYYTLSTGQKIAQREYKDLISQGKLTDTVITDTAYYSFSGQKAMLNVSFNLSKLLSVSWLAENDLKFYFEAILLGLKNYPTFYDKQSDRMAYAFGVNVPTFRVLDMLAIEMEYCSNPYENSTRGPYGDGIALPHLDNVSDKFPNVPKIDQDNLKWTIYAKKKVYDGFSIYAQAASDHIKMLDVYSSPNFYDFLVKKNQWYWAFKLAYSI
jgi:hypothetical protein